MFTFSLFNPFTGCISKITTYKFKVLLSQLLLLFKFCPFCKADNPLVETRQPGAMAVITSTCTNKKCNRKETVWRRQPNIPCTRIPAGNFLFCMSILMSGSSASKVLQMFIPQDFLQAPTCKLVEPLQFQEVHIQLKAKTNLS